MEKVKELERELGAKGEELEKIKKAKRDLATRRPQNEYQRRELYRKRASVFADAELDENKVMQKKELKEKIKGLEEDLEDISLAMEELNTREGKLSREIETLETQKEAYRKDFLRIGILKGEYKEECKEEKEKEKRKKQGAIYYKDPAQSAPSPLRLIRIKLEELARHLGINEDLQKFFKGVEKEFGKLEGA